LDTVGLTPSPFQEMLINHLAMSLFTFSWRKIRNRAIILLVLGVGAYFGYDNRDEIRDRINYQLDIIERNPSHVPFESRAWQDPYLVHSENYIRIRMVDDLEEKLNDATFKSNSFMTRSQVIKLLGRPDKIEHYRDWDMAYWLAPVVGSTNSESYWFVIQIVDNNFVKSEIHRVKKD
jgi:hypothetical protein